MVDWMFLFPWHGMGYGMHANPEVLAMHTVPTNQSSVCRVRFALFANRNEDVALRCVRVHFRRVRLLQVPSRCGGYPGGGVRAGARDVLN